MVTRIPTPKSKTPPPRSARKAKRPNLSEIVTRDRSVEWGDYYYYLPDPDVILENTGNSSEVFAKLLADAHVLSCYQSRKAGVLTVEHRISYPKGTEHLSDFFDHMFDRLPISDILAQFLDAPFYGFAVCEIIWTLANGKWIPAEISQKPNKWFVWDKQGKLRFLSKNNEWTGELLPDRKFLVPKHFPTYENPYGMRLLSRCFWPVAFKKGGFKYWMQFLEKFGVPWLIAKVRPGTTQETRDNLITKLDAMVQSAVAVINDDESIEVLDVKLSKQGNDNPYNQMISVANAEISKAILGQTLTTEIGNKGAYAASQSHLAVRQEICAGDQRIAVQVMNQLIRWVCEFNFPPMETYPAFAFHQEDDAKEEHARRDTQLWNQGVRPTEGYYVRTYGLRPDEFTIEKQAPAGIVGGPQANESKQKDQRLQDRKDPKQKLKQKGGANAV